MIRFNNLKTAASARKYYIVRQSLEAYYCDNQEFNGYWGGKGAGLLGLSGYMRERAFTRLLENLHPETGEKLTPRTRADRRPGFDLTFDPPKSVSLAYAFTKDERIIKAFREAVAEIRDEMEKDAATRVRAGQGKNADSDRTTGNWVAAEFVHLTARPQDGFPDPQMHVHLVVLNLTFDPEERRWKALQMGRIHEEAQYYEAGFHRLLQEKLEAIGLETVAVEKGFEIAGIERPTIDKFSRRTATIEETARRLGITDPERKAKLGLITRERKNKRLLMPELELLWASCLTEEEKKAFEGLKTRLQRSRAAELSAKMTAGMEAVGIERTAEALGTARRLPEPQGREPSTAELGKNKRLREGQAPRRESMNSRTRPGHFPVKDVEATVFDREAVALAMEHIYQRSSVVSEKTLMGEAFSNWRVKKATFAGIKKVVEEEAPLLRKQLEGRVLVTTPEVLAEEQRLTELCQRGKSKFGPINKHWQIDDEQLNEGQREAVCHALRSRDFITGIAGIAGSGKTTVIREICRGIRAGLHDPVVLAALSATAHENLRRDGFESAETIAKFLNSAKLQKQAQDGVIMVDEAGLISNRLADAFLAVAESLNAQVILVGDAGQLHSVERGQAFDHLRRHGGMAVAEVTEILRQKDGPYRQFVEMYVSGETRRAVTSLWSMEAMVEQPLEKLKHTLAKDYVDALEKGKSCLATSPTHAEIDRLTGAIRDELKERKRLGRAVAWDVLRNQSWTDAQKRDLEHYYRPLEETEADKNGQKGDDERKVRKGLVIQFNGHVKGFALGERVEVIDIRDDVVRVRVERPYHTEIKKLPLHEAEKFSVYERDKIEICEGDKIQITGNGRDANGRRVNNGTCYTVDYVSHDGKLVLENGLQIDRSFPHLSHGWVVTAYAAQGMTVDCVFACQTEVLSAAATNQDQFHVATTRGREVVKTYTDNFEWLKDSVSKRPDRMMATDLVEREETERSLAADQRLCDMEREEFKMRPEVEDGGRTEPEQGTAVEVSVTQPQSLAKGLGKSGAETMGNTTAEMERITRKKQERERERKLEMTMEMEM